MENLGIDGKLLLAQLINFILFFYILKKYIAGPFLKFLNQERQNEREKEDLLGKIKKGEEEILAREIKLKEEMKKQVSLALEKAKKDGFRLREEIVEEAKKQAMTIKDKAHKEIKEERDKLYRDVKNKVADLSFIITEKALQDYLDEEAKKKITGHILKNLGNAINKHEN
ncbi:ATP synthase F0 subunit B [Candidatus Roizmanbacteria bacterium RIFCSPLOWO2_01_FULL_37_12]|uniref:ATP synthase subunit b n=1 Tax=Candidatus Roizmanbacteria bacterium RIFCSPLOWO2_01_FULL_37_12 TaxID=1802056 RepID=A0A1F7I938_9BACT|nr:MAG: ATP synthase F0 subunit B [Candidatus Roizmanbacteria bacterium RIFCSPHIGHO2_02_FULL_37_9b]OGK39864.1 MAG: ATP synthase F0 subunit B [Candidatus Roizmanbacteria bacterium RIFCSPLOWO2_01_FULL_37_12]